MAKPETTSWQGGGTYCNGTCDMEGCEKNPNFRLWYSPSVFNGDDELIASACREHLQEIKQRHGHRNN